MEQPWAGTPKTSHDQVIDCLAQAPVILESIRSLPLLSITQQVDLLQYLICKCWRIDKQLDLTYDQIRSQDLYWRVPSSQAPTLFPVVFCFRNAQIAATLTLLWATRTLLWSGLCNIYQHLESIPGPVAGYEGSVRGSRCGEYLSVAHQVCQSVEYFLRDDMLLAGPLSVSPALGIVLDSLRNRPGHGPEIAWIQSALEVVRRKGLRVLQDFKL
ncbi:hypothetical protein PDIG_17050 [Penicillium digitatum PHI26]|uniref:C6 transcription factor n=1 Tax=Penicillium digitatum (strain PHI26 / CECT 20796) TaxID=1170229 RepID=K9G503_PEND2|nr:hypothetical protein PDIG_17050 [Penicillium digitatum PHI26]